MSIKFNFLNPRILLLIIGIGFVGGVLGGPFGAIIGVIIGFLIGTIFAGG